MTCADKAIKLVLHDRNATYGDPADDYRKVAKIWSGLLAPILKRDITPQEAILMMVGLKLSREVHLPKEDNIIDAHGYLLCYEWAKSGQRPEPAGVPTPPVYPTIEDGFGNVWTKCGKADCGLHVVRPGKTQCDVCDNQPCNESYH